MRMCFLGDNIPCDMTGKKENLSRIDFSLGIKIYL
jgi:hypothetical protein